MTIQDERTFNLEGETVFLDPSHLDFNEATLNNFIKSEHGWFDYFGQVLAAVEFQSGLVELAIEKRVAEVMKEAKDGGASDKLAEACAKSDMHVVDLKKAAIELKRRILQVKHHLRAFDKAHDNAQSLGHNLRKEMEKLSGEIFHGKGQNLYAIEDQIETMMGP